MNHFPIDNDITVYVILKQDFIFFPNYAMIDLRIVFPGNPAFRVLLHQNGSEISMPNIDHKYCWYGQISMPYGGMV